MSSVLLLEYFHAHEPAYRTAPPSMLSEGRTMLLSVLEDLWSLPDIHVRVAVCEAAMAELSINPRSVVRAGNSQSLDELVDEVVTDSSDVDVVLTIAPETDGVLTSLAQNFRRRGFRFLGPRTEVVEACSDKWLTCELLRRRGLPTVPTELATNAPSPGDFRGSEMRVQTAGRRGLRRYRFRQAERRLGASRKGDNRAAVFYHSTPRQRRADLGCYDRPGRGAQPPVSARIRSECGMERHRAELSGWHDSCFSFHPCTERTERAVSQDCMGVAT